MSKDALLKTLTIFVIGVGIQLLLILLGTDGPKDSPRHAAIEFAQAYFRKDPHMVNRICKAELTDKLRYQIEKHLRDTTEEARIRGFAPGFMASTLYAIKTDTRLENDTHATVRMTGKRKTAINQVYFLVGLLFNIGETHSVDHTFRLVKEGDGWKICDQFTAILQSI